MNSYNRASKYNDNDLKFAPLKTIHPWNNSPGNDNYHYGSPYFDGYHYGSPYIGGNPYGAPFTGFPPMLLNPINPLNPLSPISPFNPFRPIANQITDNNIPIAKYPDKIPNFYEDNSLSTPNNSSNNNFNSNTNNLNTNSAFNNNNVNLEDEYPSEDSADELYSYNTNTIMGSNNPNNLITPTEILRNIDFSLDDMDSRKSYSNKDIDAIFNSIQEKNPSIFSALKAYRVPYPIATLLIKKIIQSTLDYKTTGGK